MINPEEYLRLYNSHLTSEQKQGDGTMSAHHITAVQQRTGQYDHPGSLDS